MYVGNFRNLIFLNLSHNPLTSIPRAINILTNIYSFYFGNTSITSIKFDSEVHNKYLQLITLSDSPNLIDVGDCGFCNFPNLTLVTLSYSPKLSAIDENAFGCLTELSAIKIESCNITTIPETLLKLRAFIYIKNNPILNNSAVFKNPLIKF